MMGNPEFRKNLWLELTPYRLIGMPLVILSILYLAYLTGGSRVAHDVASASITFYFLITVVWGSKQTSETIVNEIREHTWDGQRMSSLTPWQLVWGKLFGSTAYTWYGSAMLLAAYGVAAPDLDAAASAETVAVLVLTGIFAHAVTLLGSLLSIQKERKFVRTQSTAILLLGIMTASICLAIFFGQGGNVSWLGASYPLSGFMLATMAAFTLWAVLGVYQLMRRELQMTNPPAAWFAFLLFIICYCGGLVAGQKVPANDPFQGVNRPVLVGFYIAVAACYVMALLERKDLLTLQRVLRLLQEAQWRRFLQRAPRWLLTFPLAMVMALAVIATASPGVPGGMLEVAAFSAAVIFFVARDLAILLFCNLARSSKRADLLAILYLLLLYGIIPAIFKAMQQDAVTVLFWPQPDRPPFLLVVPLLEMLAVFYLLSVRWKKRVAEIGR